MSPPGAIQTNLDLSEEEAMIRDTVRKFAQEEVAKTAEEVDRESRFPIEHFRKMAELGLMGIPIPEEYEGGGFGALSYILAIEELAKVCGSTCLSYAAHVSLGTMPIYAFGNEEQRRRYVPDLASGRKLGAFGLTEPGSGSDAAGIKTTAKKDGKHYVLNGAKCFITNANYADTFIATAITDPSRGPQGISAFILEKGWPGFSVVKGEEKLGTRGSDWGSLVFHDCRVPEENRMGKEGEGFSSFMKTLEGGRIGIGAMALGLAEGAFERSVKHANERRTFGKTIGHHQAVGFKLADMETEIEAARHLVYHAARLRDAGKPFGHAASIAKLYASEMAMRVTYEAIQVLGGYGFCTEFQVERYYRDAKLCTIGEGTSEIQRIIISRNVLKG